MLGLKGFTDIGLLPVGKNAKVIPLLTSEFAEAQGAISPDEKWLAYLSNESGKFEVYVRSLPEISSVQAGRWRISLSGGGAPRWRRDGRELYYVDPENRIMSVETGGNVEFRAGTPQPLFRSCGYGFAQGAAPSADYDVSADGQRFLINCLSEETLVSPITVVVNWMEKLKR